MHYCEKIGESWEVSYCMYIRRNSTIIYADPKPQLPKIPSCIFVLKSSRNMTWVKVILRSHVEELGRCMAFIKCRLGVCSKPAPGILLAPDINCRMSHRATPDLPSKQNNKQTNKQAS